MGDSSFLRGLNPKDYVTEQFGLPTIKDIISELEKPGRDPRPEFRFASFEEGVETLSDLKPGMVLEGSVTNVTNFGAFVDIGVHQDGLVHISALSHTFVKDPREVVKAGDIVKVKVMDVDIPASELPCPCVWTISRVKRTMASQPVAGVPVPNRRPAAGIHARAAAVRNNSRAPWRVHWPRLWPRPAKDSR